MTLNLNTDNVIEYANTLEKLRDKAFVGAVKNTLNTVAFAWKGSKNTGPGTILKETEKRFNKRNKGFFKAASTIKMAAPADIDKMASTVGFTDRRLNSSGAVENLEKQQSGGSIEQPFAALDRARVAKSYTRKVQKKNQLSKIDQVVDAQDQQGASDAERYIKAAIEAGPKGLVMGTEDAQGRRFLLRVNSVTRRGRNTKINSTPLYVYEQGREINIQGTKFQTRAADKAAERIEEFFKQNAEFQLKKYR
jgi:hypothetical protein